MSNKQRRSTGNVEGDGSQAPDTGEQPVSGALPDRAAALPATAALAAVKSANAGHWHARARQADQRRAGTEVEIEIANGLATIRPPLLDLVRESLEYQQTLFELGGPLGERSRVVTRRLYELDSQGRLVVMVGSVAGIRRTLEQHGYPVTLRDHRRWPARCRKTEERLQDELTVQEQTMLGTLRTNRAGQLIVRGRREQTRAIEIIGRHWPDAIMLIPVATLRHVDELYGDLVAPFGSSLTRARGGNWARESNRVVCTYEPLRTCIPQGVDIVVFAEVASMFNEKVFEAIRDLPEDILRYAVVQADEMLDRVTQIRLEALCGPVIYRNPDPRGEPAAVRVVLCDAPHLPTIAYRNPLDRKRRAFWHNTARNTVIAEIATAFADGDQQALWKHGLGLEDGPESLAVRPGDRVAVLVESPEHGRELQKALRSWPLLSATPKPNTKRAADENALTAWGLPPRSILTSLRAHRVGQLAVETLIVATPDDWAGVTPGFPPRQRRAQPQETQHHENERHEILVIDMADDFDRHATEQTWQRLETYRIRGWRTRIPRSWANP